MSSSSRTPAAVAARVVGGGDVGADEQVRTQFVSIIAANYPEHPFVTGARAGVAVGQRQRRPPRRPARVLTSVLPGPPAGTGQRVGPGRAGTAVHRRYWPRQRSPPHGRPPSLISATARDRR